MGATTHHSHPAHDTDLRGRILSVVPILPERGVLGGDWELLRGVRHCELFHTAVPLYCAEFARTKGVLPEYNAEELVLGCFWTTEVYGR